MARPTNSARNESPTLDAWEMREANTDPVCYVVQVPEDGWQQLVSIIARQNVRAAEYNRRLVKGAEHSRLALITRYESVLRSNFGRDLRQAGLRYAVGKTHNEAALKLSETLTPQERETGKIVLIDFGEQKQRTNVATFVFTLPTTR